MQPLCSTSQARADRKWLGLPCARGCSASAPRLGLRVPSRAVQHPPDYMLRSPRRARKGRTGRRDKRGHEVARTGALAHTWMGSVPGSNGHEQPIAAIAQAASQWGSIPSPQRIPQRQRPKTERGRETKEKSEGDGESARELFSTSWQGGPIVWDGCKLGRKKEFCGKILVVKRRATR
jgi:hypothetical protein